MKITVKHFGQQFNVALHSKEGADPFIEIKGCRIASGAKGEFVSWPSTKKDDGTWWRHVYGSDAFGEAVLTEAKKAAPAKQAPRRPSRDEDSEIPF